jgi:cytidylate kinase
MNIPDIIIAIDGYSSTGKSSFAKIIANEFSFLYLDSGALYRGVTLFAMENGYIGADNTINVPELERAIADLDIHFGKDGTYMGDRCIEREIRSMEVAGKVSPIATVPQVRDYVDRKLREFGKAKRVVMDGRDIGTTVFPDAELKIFMTADPLIRAQRRADEMIAKGDNVDMDAVLKNLQERDYIDSHREVSPLTQAEDAIVLDNSHMTMDAQMVWIRKVISERFGC